MHVHQAGLRGDQYSYFSACSVGNKRKYTGYSEPQIQPEKSSMLGANIELTAFNQRVYASQPRNDKDVLQNSGRPQSGEASHIVVKSAKRDK